MTAILKVDTIQDTSGNNIINESSDTITIGAAGDTVTVPGTEVKSNKLSPASGTALQIGDSGDTITIPSGATITNSGTANGFGGGKILQLVSATDTSVRSTTSASYTKASNSCDVAITPSASNSKVLIMLSSGGGVGASGNRGFFSFFRDSTDLAPTGDGIRTIENTGATTSETPFVVYFLDTPNTTSQVTYSIQMKTQNGNSLYFNQKGVSTMTCMEIGA